MKYFNLITISILITLSIRAHESTHIYDIVNKKLNYQLEFKNISAGNAFILLEKDSLSNQSVIKLRSEIKTNKFIDYLYKIRNKITIYMDEHDLSLIKVINKINEGSYKKNHHALVDINKMKIINKKGEKEITQRVYSPLSIIFSIREKLQNSKNTFHYKTYSNGKLKDIDISLIGKEKIKTPFGEFNTLIITPTSTDNKTVFKNDGDMKIWYTDNEQRLPIKIEIKITFGSIILLLDNIES